LVASAASTCLLAAWQVDRHSCSTCFTPLRNLQVDRRQDTGSRVWVEMGDTSSRQHRPCLQDSAVHDSWSAHTTTHTHRLLWRAVTYTGLKTTLKPGTTHTTSAADATCGRNKAS
jgi:hypothetical protein